VITVKLRTRNRYAAVVSSCTELAQTYIQSIQQLVILVNLDLRALTFVGFYCRDERI
jgi:hypothetical protein